MNNQQYYDKKPKTPARLPQCNKANRLARRRIREQIAGTAYGRMVASAETWRVQ
jgi:hypothetical protein